MFSPYSPQNYYPQAPQLPVRQNSYLSGRVVSNEQQITPSEIPMDRSVSIFPLEDYSAIIAKQWDSTGRIQTVRYIPEQPAVSQDDPFIALNARFDRLEELISKQKIIQKPKIERKEETL